MFFFNKKLLTRFFVFANKKYTAKKVRKEGKGKKQKEGERQNQNEKEKNF